MTQKTHPTKKGTPEHVKIGRYGTRYDTVQIQGTKNDGRDKMHPATTKSKNEAVDTLLHPRPRLFHRVSP